MIPGRVEGFIKEFSGARDGGSVDAMLKDPGLDVISICLPTDLHAVYAVKALRAKKHVILETPPTVDAKGMKAILRAAEKAGKVVIPAFQRHFGPHEAAARQAVEKGYAGEVYHVRATWHRPSGVPQGARTATEASGWYTDPARSGGGAMIDLGLPLLEVGWSLLGYPAPESVMAVAHHRLTKLPVEESGTALVRFAGGKALELSSAWAIASPPSHYGVACRAHGTGGSVDVYTPQGAMLYRGQDKAKATVLKGPKVVHHAALMRELKARIAGPEAERLVPARRALTLMKIVEAWYKSAKSGKSADVKE